ncbi:Signal transduction histidine kinase [Candidatus Phaeomarinobacter ectocarpi]|uniref:histidine kinase n=1 Tax=Candidatus Phaeomarinibacter ectocarpi TaxID=1458461 RepID=X5M5V1_9HYPH|nr:CHASE2 domain-containing protein [Candidatus Phaeomarinobacter ectocarpi]CDO58253.1 Signal transduction histidine kinase [Candidatus Phaeomarinobacter ectocarpi]
MQRLIQGCAVFFIAMSAYAFGALETLELALLESRFDLLDRPASGEVVAVQIDARSIQELGQWPLPRNTYAYAVRSLVAAGANEIAIDVDMSARTNENETAALARALEDAGGHVILPAFTQLAEPGVYDGNLIDAEPTPALTPHAWLGSVNVIPDKDGRLRQLMHGMWNADGEFRYSMFALLAGKAKPQPEPFYVDYGIDVRTIPRISFVDVMEGRFDVNVVNGKRVIIGGTAVELGDHFAVPRYGVMSGPMVQAMGFETLHQDREIHRTGPIGVVLLVILVLAGALCMPQQRGWFGYAAIVAVAVFGLLAVSGLLQHFVAISLDVLPALFALMLVFGLQLVLMSDIQRRNAARQKRIAAHQRILLDRVVSDSFDGIAILDAQGRIEQANTQTFDLCNVPQAASGATIDDLLENLSPDRDRPSAGWHTAPPGEPIMASVFKDGKEHHLEMRLNRSDVPIDVPTPNGTTYRHVLGLTIRDVTDSVLAVTAQREAREQAERANRAKTDFLANMGHELRTPLNAVIGFAELMEQQAMGPLGSPDYLEYAAHISGSGRHLLNIVNDIMEISRAEMGSIELADEAICLAEIAESAIHSARGDANACAHTIKTEFDFTVGDVLADASRIQRAVSNLISNAACYSPPDEQIVVRTLIDDQGHPTIEVEDHGEGIPAEMLSSILMPFQQVRASAHRSSDGIGLGLTIVSAFMKQHGGTIEIDSSVGVGTTVRLIFPVSRRLGTGQLDAAG